MKNFNPNITVILTTIILSYSCNNVNSPKEKENTVTLFTADIIINKLLEPEKHIDNVFYPHFSSIDWGATDLKWEDIPKFLKIANNKKTIQDFPHNPKASQTMISENTIGEVALWFIESIRIKDGKGFPCLYCRLLIDSTGSIRLKNDVQTEAYLAYLKWWTNNRNQSKDSARKINPLEGTHIYWY